MEIKPFNALRFVKEKAGDIGSCISPPYDVIDKDAQGRLYEKNEYNIVRITKGISHPSDNENDNQYTRAAGYFKKWMEQGVLRQNGQESIYAYIHDFQVEGKNFRRNSFIALGRLEEFGAIVRPHENTLSAPKTDRLKLQLATGAKFGLIFMLYKDEKRVADAICEKAMRTESLVDFVDEQSVRHRLFAIADNKDINSIGLMMANKSCIIADGHHRYETALEYYRQTENPAAKYQMLAFANMLNEGLIVLATHRLVKNVKDFNMDKLIADIKNNFKIVEYRFDSSESKLSARKTMLREMKDLSEKGKNAFGIYAGGNSYYVAVLQNESAMNAAAPGKSSAWRSLDVSVLHKLILEDLLGIGDKNLEDKINLEYLKDSSGAIDEAISRIDAGTGQIVFFMNPEKMANIQLVADAGEKMPQKSTYFYPKMYTGLTIQKL